MKKILLSALFCGASLLIFAQPTMNFEMWSGSGTVIAPSGWVSANVLTAFPSNPQSVFKDSTIVHGGKYSMKIFSVTLSNTPGAPIPNPVGLAATGNVVGTQFKIGFPYTSRPASMDFWYHYVPVSGGDTATCFIYLWNGVSKDTIAAGLWKTSTTTTAYATQNLALTYNPAMSGVTPDSMAIVFSSTRLFNNDTTFCTNCGKAGSTLWVDDVVLNIPSGINDKNISNQGVILYPNPAVDYIYISVDTEDAYAVNVYDITGKQVRSLVMQESQNGFNKKAATISTANLSNGLYSYTITDKDGNALRAGKLNIAR